MKLLYLFFIIVGLIAFAALIIQEVTRPSPLNIGRQIIPTSEMLQRCSELGIEREKCTQEAILERECLGMNCGGTGANQIEVLQNPSMLTLFGLLIAGLGGAVFYIKSRKGKNQDIEG
jgi:hypothetical protein